MGGDDYDYTEATCSFNVTYNNWDDDPSTIGDDDDIYRDAWDEIGITCGIYTVGGVCLGLLFEVARGNQIVYGRRSRTMPLRTPELPRRWPLAWLLPIWNSGDEKEVRRKVGLDGYVCLRYLRLCFQICLFCSFWCATVLMPVYSHGQEGIASSFGYITMDNVRAKAQRLWAPTIFMYFFVAYTLYSINMEWKVFLNWRAEFLEAGDPDAEGGRQLAYSIRVESIPPELRSDLALFSHFEMLFPGQVHSAVVHNELGVLPSLIAERRRVCEKLEVAIATWDAGRLGGYKGLSETTLSADGGAPSARDLSPVRPSIGEATHAGDYDPQGLASSVSSPRPKKALFAFRGELETLNGELAELEALRHTQRDAPGRSASKSHEGAVAGGGREAPGSGSSGPRRGGSVEDGVRPEEEIDGGGGGGGKNETDGCGDSRGAAHIIEPIAGEACCGGLMIAVDEIHFYTAKLLTLNAAVAEAQKSVLTASEGVEESLSKQIREQLANLLRREEQLKLVDGIKDTNPQSSAPLASAPADANARAREPRASAHGETGVGPGQTRARSRSSRLVESVDNSIEALGRAVTRSGTAVTETVTAVTENVTGVGEQAIKTVQNHALNEIHTLADGAVLGAAALGHGLKILVVGGDHRAKTKSSSGYVTFKSKRAVTDAKQLLLTRTPFTLEVLEAEDPRSIIWDNATVSATERRVRVGATAILVIWFAVAGYIPILTLCSTLSNLDNLSTLQGLGWLGKIPHDDDASALDVFVYDMLQNQLPVGLQVLILALLPILFQNLSLHYEKAKTLAEVQASIMSRYFLFQLVQIFASLVSGSLLSALVQILREPGCIFQLLGTAVPLTAVYFTQIIIIKAFLGLNFELSRLWPLIRITWFKHFQRERSSKAQKRRIQTDTTEFMTGWIYPNFLLVFIVCFSYAVIVPFIMIIGTGYFAIAFCVYKHQLLFVYCPRYETGGSLFPTLYGYTLTGVNFAIITIMGYLLFKQGLAQFFMLTPLVGLVECFRYYTATAYGRAISVLSTEGAKDVDSIHYEDLAPGSVTSNSSTSDGDSWGSGTNHENAPTRVAVHETFDSNLYRQRALEIRDLEPEIGLKRGLRREIRGKGADGRRNRADIADGDQEDNEGGVRMGVASMSSIQDLPGSSRSFTKSSGDGAISSHIKSPLLASAVNPGAGSPEDATATHHNHGATTR